MSGLAAVPEPAPSAGASGGPAGCLAIVAGRGALPRQIVEARQAAGLPYLLILFPGCEEAWMESHPRQHHRFEKVGALFAGLRAAGVAALVFAGAMTRPRLRPWTCDWQALAIMPRALALLTRGDDAMLRGFAAIFEARGIRLVGVGEILGDGLMLAAGALGQRRPRPADLADAARAAGIVAALAPHDVGQAAVVARGLCLGVEAIEGTDLMLARIAALPADRRRAAPPPCGVLLKIPKPGQDRRFDMPTFGPDTVRGAAAAGLGGLVGLAGATQIVDREGTRRIADAEALFVYGASLAELALEEGP